MQAPDTPALHAPGQASEHTLTTDSQALRSPDTHTQSWLNSLKDVNSEVQNAFDVPNLQDQRPLPGAHESTKVVWPKTVAELVEVRTEPLSLYSVSYLN